MLEMREYTLGELVLNYNSARRPIKSTHRTPGSTPYYGASGIVDWVEGYTHDGEFLLISEDGENLRSRGTPIAFTASGRIWVNNHAHVVAGRESYDTRFLQYALGGTDIAGYLTGSAQPKLTKAAMESIKLLLPESHHRRGISEVLGSLDDKIVANNRLRELADQLLQAKFAALSRGRRSVELRDIAQVNVAQVKPEIGGTLKYLDISAVGQGSYDLPPDSSWETAPGRARRALREGDTVWSTVRPNRRSHALVLDQDTQLVASTGLAVLSPRPNRIAGVYEASRTDKFVAYLESVAEGSAYPAVRADRFSYAPVPELNVREWDAFEAEALPLRRRSHASTQESRVLTTLRDELLPMLMSGKVRLRDVRENMEGVA